MWDGRYNTEEYIYGTSPNKFLYNNYTIIPKGDVLCLAEGEGRNAVFLAKQGYTVTAVDSSIVGLKKVRRLAEKNNLTIEIIQADLETFDLGVNRWDGIVSIFCHVPLVIRKKLHEKVVAGLKSNGVLLLEAFTPDQLKHDTGGPPTEDLMMSKALLTQELIDLKFSHLQEVEYEVIEGTYHSGIAAVVQAIGFKQKI